VKQYRDQRIATIYTSPRSTSSRQSCVEQIKNPSPSTKGDFFIPPLEKGARGFLDKQESRNQLTNLKTDFEVALARSSLYLTFSDVLVIILMHNENSRFSRFQAEAWSLERHAPLKGETDSCKPVLFRSPSKH